MKKTAFLHLLSGLMLLSAPLARAQQDGTANPNSDPASEEAAENVQETDDNRRFWQASLPGGHYMVALDRISSISMHQYLLDGTMVVNEMIIDTNGRSLVRFYHVTTSLENSASGTARRVVERGNELLDRVGQKTGTDVKEIVQKNYPSTSHAGMVEFRVQSVAELDAIYKSVKGAWETGKGRKVTVK
ncbi:hypothetical protein OKA04_08350 [Luteolibacter flavescens]|uniref:Uncharacterized protein n=1 Tax=Luteolibacter flavescens TaxID=1859460 RepID=A0ABT3FNB2_9BACT|nr:hypothetical protein [Luteolibacter flavescens]MCW1884736.1 hypothetical protein [Luteolibacter flavescens]